MRALFSRVNQCLLATLMVMVAQVSLAVPISLSGFSAPSGNVAISADGSQAIFTEDPFYTPISLENYNLALPGDAVSLSFDYDLLVPVGNEDYFDFYFDNLSAPLFSVGGYADPAVAPLEWTGNYEIDVSSYAGTTVPVIFDLLAWDWALDSVLTISNVQIVQSTPVAEPGTLALLMIGIFALLGSRRRVGNI